jgi:hypothetical protein
VSMPAERRWMKPAFASAAFARSRSSRRSTRSTSASRPGGPNHTTAARHG